MHQSTLTPPSDRSSTAQPSLLEVFGQHVTGQPEATALRFSGGTLSYGELDRRANGLAHRLVDAGVGRETAVAISMRRSPDLVIAMLAVLKAGGAYVPLHHSYPDARVRLIVNETRAPVVLADRASEHRTVRVAQDQAVLVVDERSSAERADPPPSRCDRRHLAYVMYTSGSTGRPRGVAIERGSILSLAADRRWDGGRHDRVLFHSSHAFDASTYEIWVPLLRGGTVVVAPDEDLDPHALRDLIAEHGVTAAFLTTALFNVIAELAPDALAGLREVLAGGELASPAAFRRVVEACPDTIVSHVYGPTECTTFATYHRITHHDDLADTVPIGRAMDETETYVLDDELRPVEEGELYLAGAGLARGYLGQQDVTGQRFVSSPVARTRLYRTGDLVRRDRNGNLVFVGRQDDQIKLRGFRIELGEIHRVLDRCADVAQASVQVRTDGGEAQIVAYVVAPAGVTPDVEDLRLRLARTLPTYMVPTALVVLDRLPLNANGKVDVTALPAPIPAPTASEKARTPEEAALCTLFGELLGVPDIGIDDDFFALGGHSLLMTRLKGLIRARLEVDIPLRALFELPTVADIAREVAARRAPAAL